MNQKLVYVRVKLKSLAEEARMIRLEEARARNGGKMELFEGLHCHRINKVRTECRDTHVAYAYLRNRPYKSVEPTAKTEPDWDNVKRMVKQYGLPGSSDGFDTWVGEAKLPIEFVTAE